MLKTWIVFAFLVLPASAFAAEPFASDWAPSPKSRARLIGDGAGQAAFQVELAPGAITYWRDPGEAGVPPTFDFAGSQNLVHAELLYPAPHRIAEPDGSEAFGYEKAVLFPVRVQAADPTKPVILAISAQYGVCEKICLPARANLTLVLTPGASPYVPDIAAARARVPAKVDPPSLALISLDAKTWSLCLPAMPGAARDLFVEPPRGWWLTASKAPGEAGSECFALALREAPADAKFPAEVRATFVGSGQAVETELKLTPKS